MSTQAYTPGIGNSPFGNLNTNPQSSNYAVDSGYSPAESLLIAKAIRRAIFDAAPAQYNALKLLTMKGYKEVNNDEFEYVEKTFGRTALESNDTEAALAAVPGSEVTYVVTLTAASMAHVTPDLIIIFADGTKGLIKSVNTATNEVTIVSQTSVGLPAVAPGDLFAIQSTIKADGMDYFSNYERLQTITRYNYVQFFARAERWAKVELQKYINSGTTDYLTHAKEEKMKQLRIDLFNSYMNGTRGEFRISNNYIAKSMGGVYPTMQAAGSLSGNPTLAGLQSMFETLAFQTNFKTEGGTRFIYATDEMLNEFSKIYKQPGLRYEPNDEVAKLRLNRIELGTMNFVLVPCELFREDSCFPSEWRRKVLVVDQESITPVKMKGIPAQEMGGTLDRKDNGTREDFKDWWVEAQLSQEFNNPVGSFWIDVQ